MENIALAPALTADEQKLATEVNAGRAIRAYRARTGLPLAICRKQVDSFLLIGVSLPLALNIEITEG